MSTGQTIESSSGIPKQGRELINLLQVDTPPKFRVPLWIDPEGIHMLVQDPDSDMDDLMSDDDTTYHSSDFDELSGSEEEYDSSEYESGSGSGSETGSDEEDDSDSDGFDSDELGSELDFDSDSGEEEEEEEEEKERVKHHKKKSSTKKSKK